MVNVLWLKIFKTTKLWWLIQGHLLQELLPPEVRSHRLPRSRMLGLGRRRVRQRAQALLPGLLGLRQPRPPVAFIFILNFRLFHFKTWRSKSREKNFMATCFCILLQPQQQSISAIFFVATKVNRFLRGLNEKRCSKYW